MTNTKKLSYINLSFLIFFFSFIFLSAEFITNAEARARGGGRSFSRSSKSFSRTPRSTRSTAPRKDFKRPGGFMGSSFMKGMAGGLLGGMLGGMLFRGVGHGMGAGMGGAGGSGIGLFEILIIGVIIFFLVRWFRRKKKNSSYPGIQQFANSSPMTNDVPSPSEGVIAQNEAYPPDSITDGLELIKLSDPQFDEETFKEIAQNVFFKVQASWMRRDIEQIKPLLVPELITQWENDFAEMRKKGEINRLENIAVRKVNIVDAWVETGEEHITLQFTANLLDYTTDESGQIISGDQNEPVKFDEKWTFIRNVGSANWLLAAIQE